MGRNKRVPVEKWNALMERVLVEPIWKPEICRQLKIKDPEQFKDYVYKTSDSAHRLYTIKKGYFSLAKSENEHKVIDEKLTNVASGFLTTRKANQDKMFDLLQLMPYERQQRVLNDPIYKMWKSEVSNIGRIGNYPYEIIGCQQSEPTQEIQSH
jgi:hypothetical protein